MSRDRELRREDHEVPEYAAQRGARLEGILGRVSDAPLREDNGISLLKNGPDTYDDWLTAISRAKKWIHLHNYIIASDEIGNRFARALSAKAREGVRVRALHDWFGCIDVPFSHVVAVAALLALVPVGLAIPALALSGAAALIVVGLAVWETVGYGHSRSPRRAT